MIAPLLLALTATFAAPTPVVEATTTQVATTTTMISAPSAKTLGEYVKKFFADDPVLANIAWCESRFRQWNPDGTIFRGSVNRYDVGVMQVNVLYHEDIATDLGMDLYTLAGNLAYAKHLYDKEGTKPWASSEACWDKLAKR